MSTRVMSVETERPQATVVPRPFHISEPSPRPNAMGSIPSTVVRVVIRMGRIRALAAVMEASRTLYPRSCKRMV